MRFCLSSTGVLVLAWLCLGLGIGHAQPGPPAGGYSLREVRQLPRVPEPAGGLVPFRQGKQWGYADSTGRLVIAPQLEYPESSGTTFLRDGFAEIGTRPLPDKFTQRLDRRRREKRPHYRAVFLNARGQLLLIKMDDAAIQLPDGSLVRRKRNDAVGQTELQALEFDRYNECECTGFGNFVRGKVAPYQPPLLGKYYSVLRNQRWHIRKWWYSGDRLGQHRTIVTNRLTGGSPHFRPDPYLDNKSPRQRRQYFNPDALATEQGHRLTRFRFARIGEFVHGLALAEMATYHGTREAPQSADFTGYIDRQGRWRIPARFTSATDFRHGVAIAAVADKTGVIDTTGRFIYPPQRQHLSYDPDEAGFVRRQLVDSSRADPIAVQLLPPPGTRFAGDSLFQGAGAFRNGRAWVRLGSRQGLIDTHGRWVTPLAYELLVAPTILHALPPAQLVVEAEYENFWTFQPHAG